MTADRCEPPDGAEDGSWHYITDDRGDPTVAAWVLIYEGGWYWQTITGEQFTPETAYNYAYRYLRPIPPPAELAARDAAVARLVEAAGELVAASSQDPDGRFIVGEDEICELSAALAAMKEHKPHD